jgi:ATP-binding protein involved in chromosome partitioning
MQFKASTFVTEILKKHPLPWLNQDVVSTGWLQEVHLHKNSLNVQLKLGFPLSAAFQDKIRHFLAAALQNHAEIDSVKISIECQVRAHAFKPGIAAIPGVKNVIAVGSGKGGVGKSTTAVNLALALSHHGARTGLLDADIYGSNQPHMLGAKGRPEIREDKKILPLVVNGLQTMSIDYLMDEVTAMVWRGPMISAAMWQLFRDTLWDNLDYLVVDLPPGTGDIQLTLAEKAPVTGVVIVTTPQDVALLDSRKGLEMFRHPKVNVPVLGVIENMSMHICNQCGHEEALFGEGGGERLAQSCGVPLFGRLPLALKIREDSDNGKPTVAADPNSRWGELYQEIALRIAAQISQQKLNYSTRFPPIVVE